MQSHLKPCAAGGSFTIIRAVSDMIQYFTQIEDCKSIIVHTIKQGVMLMKRIITFIMCVALIATCSAPVLGEETVMIGQMYNLGGPYELTPSTVTGYSDTTVTSDPGEIVVNTDFNTSDSNTVYLGDRVTTEEIEVVGAGEIHTISDGLTTGVATYEQQVSVPFERLGEYYEYLQRNGLRPGTREEIESNWTDIREEYDRNQEEFVTAGLDTEGVFEGVVPDLMRDITEQTLTDMVDLSKPTHVSQNTDPANTSTASFKDILGLVDGMYDDFAIDSANFTNMSNMIGSTIPRSDAVIRAPGLDIDGAALNGSNKNTQQFDNLVDKLAKQLATEDGKTNADGYYIKAYEIASHLVANPETYYFARVEGDTLDRDFIEGVITEVKEEIANNPDVDVYDHDQSGLYYDETKEPESGKKIVYAEGALAILYEEEGYITNNEEYQQRMNDALQEDREAVAKYTADQERLLQQAEQLGLKVELETENGQAKTIQATIQDVATASMDAAKEEMVKLNRILDGDNSREAQESMLRPMGLTVEQAQAKVTALENLMQDSQAVYSDFKQYEKTVIGRFLPNGESPGVGSSDPFKRMEESAEVSARFQTEELGGADSMTENQIRECMALWLDISDNCAGDNYIPSESDIQAYYNKNPDTSETIPMSDFMKSLAFIVPNSDYYDYSEQSIYNAVATAMGTMDGDGSIVIWDKQSKCPVNFTAESAMTWMSSVGATNGKMRIGEGSAAKYYNTSDCLAAMKELAEKRGVNGIIQDVVMMNGTNFTELDARHTGAYVIFNFKEAQPDVPGPLSIEDMKKLTGYHEGTLTDLYDLLTHPERFEGLDQTLIDTLRQMIETEWPTWKEDMEKWKLENPDLFEYLEDESTRRYEENHSSHDDTEHGGDGTSEEDSNLVHVTMDDFLRWCLEHGYITEQDLGLDITNEDDLRRITQLIDKYISEFESQYSGTVVVDLTRYITVKLDTAESSLLDKIFNLSEYLMWDLLGPGGIQLWSGADMGSSPDAPVPAAGNYLWRVYEYLRRFIETRASYSVYEQWTDEDGNLIYSKTTTGNESTQQRISPIVEHTLGSGVYTGGDGDNGDDTGDNPWGGSGNDPWGPWGGSGGTGPWGDSGYPGGPGTSTGGPGIGGIGTIYTLNGGWINGWSYGNWNTNGFGSYTGSESNREGYVFRVE